MTPPRNAAPRFGFPAALFVLFAACGATCSGVEAPDGDRGPAPGALAPLAAGRVEILWDTWGVPHVTAGDERALLFGYGWAQMEAHGDLVLRLYGEARGRAAEYWGEEHLAADRWLRTVGVPQRAAAWLAAQTPQERAMLEAFAAGTNAWAQRHGATLTAASRAVLPVTPEDLLAHAQRVLLFEFVTSRAEVEEVAAAAAREAPRAGSNAWAVAPARSASGRALLLANPHLPWSDFFVWFEAHLVAPGVDVYGAGLVGQPLLGIGFNDRLGWTHTVNTFDGADLYALRLVPGGYAWEGGVRAFDAEEQVLGVQLPDGGLREERLFVRRSVHGPVVAVQGDHALALRLSGLDQPHLLGQYWAMARARDLQEFEAALRRLQMPMFTVLYADRDGHVLHLFGGRTPVRPAGPWDWSGVVPGDTAATLWERTHAYGELPRVVDPPSGWLQNANDPPWTTTFPTALDPGRFPAYLAPRAMSFRAQRSARLLEEDDRLTLEELVARKHSTRMELADRILDDLLPAARGGGETARRAAAVLTSWDRAADAGSRGAVLFEAFWGELRRRMGGRRPFARPWSEQAPRTTPDGLADPAAAVVALEAAAAAVEAEHGALDVPWGEVYRLRAEGIDLPANGGPSSLGIFRVVGYEAAGDGRAEAAGGDSWVGAIEFGEPVRALGLLSYGNSSRPGSPHNGDQLRLFARQELRPLWRTRAEIEEHLESREVLAVE